MKRRPQLVSPPPEEAPVAPADPGAPGATLAHAWEEDTGVRLKKDCLDGVELDFPLMHYVDARALLGPFEADYVAWALLGERGNRSATARRLNLTRTTFLRHLKRLGLEELIPEQDLRLGKSGAAS